MTDPLEVIRLLRTALEFMRSCELSGEAGADHPCVIEALEAAAAFNVSEAEPARAPKTADADMLGGFTAETSRQAALDHYPRSGTLRFRVLEKLVAEGERGLTSDEISARWGWNLYSVKPRLIELRRGGWAERTGEQRDSPRGSGTDVYVATDEGRRVVRGYSERAPDRVQGALMDTPPAPKPSAMYDPSSDWA